MKKNLKAIVALAVAGVLAMGLIGCSSGGSKASSSAASSSAATKANNGEKLRFVTGGESGTYYAYGNVLSQFATNGDYNINITALAGNGSQANIEALQDDDADLAFAQSDVLSYAYNGTQLFDGKAYKDFSIVAALYQEQVQIVTCDPAIKTVADLKGKTVSIGASGSGVYFNALDVLKAYDMTENDIDAKFQNFGDSADSLKDGKIDAAFIVAGAPTTAITDLSTSKQAYLVSMDEAHVQKLIEANPFYKQATIPADTYGTEGPVTTVSVAAVIIANDAVPEDSIYNFVKSLFDGKAGNSSAHAKYNELVIEDAAAVADVPYHPGAAKYFTEQNITVETK